MCLYPRNVWVLVFILDELVMPVTISTYGYLAKYEAWFVIGTTIAFGQP